MSLLNVPAGKELPEDIYVVIEIPGKLRSDQIRSGQRERRPVRNRFMSTAMFYPCNYGYTTTPCLWTVTR